MGRQLQQRRRNPSRYDGVPGFKEFSGEQLVAAGAAAVLLQQSFIGAQPDYATVIQMRDDGVLPSHLASVRAGYAPSGLTGLLIAGAFSLGTRSWLPFLVGAATASFMVGTFEVIIPPEHRMNPLSAFIAGVRHYLQPDASTQRNAGGGGALPASIMPTSLPPRPQSPLRLPLPIQPGA